MLTPIKKRLVFSIIVSFVAILLVAFNNSLIPRYWVLSLIPFMVCFALFIIAVGTSISCCWEYKKIGIKALLPLLIQVFAIVIIFVVPFNEIWLKIDFDYNLENRQKVVELATAGQLKSANGETEGTIYLGSQHPFVAFYGNQIRITKFDDKVYVFFYLSTYMTGGYSGWLYVPHGGDKDFVSGYGGSHTVDYCEGKWFYLVNYDD